MACLLRSMGLGESKIYTTGSRKRRRADETDRGSLLKITESIKETRVSVKGGGGPDYLQKLHQQKKPLKHIHTHRKTLYIYIYIYIYIYKAAYRQSKLFQHLEMVQPPYLYNGACIIQAQKSQQ